MLVVLKTEDVLLNLICNVHETVCSLNVGCVKDRGRVVKLDL